MLLNMVTILYVSILLKKDDIHHHIVEAIKSNNDNYYFSEPNMYDHILKYLRGGI